MLITLAIKEMQIKMRYQFTSTKIAVIKKTVVWRNGNSHTAGGNVKWHRQFLKVFNIGFPANLYLYI